MPKVLCTRPGASDNINGHAFEPHPDGGMVSVESLPDEAAAALLEVPGYTLIPDEPADKPARHKKEA